MFTHSCTHFCLLCSGLYTLCIFLCLTLKEKTWFCTLKVQDREVGGSINKQSWNSVRESEMIGTDQRIRGHLHSSSPTEKSVAGRFLLEKNHKEILERDTKKA